MTRYIVPWQAQIPEKFPALKHRHVLEACGYVDRTR
jgi:hypothetical protein